MLIVVTQNGFVIHELLLCNLSLLRSSMLVQELDNTRLLIPCVFVCCIDGLVIIYDWVNAFDD